MLGATNPPVELARYTAAGEVRIIRGQRVLGVARISDVPLDRNHGRAFVVERELTSMREVDALVADYLAQASALNAIPAQTTLLDRELEMAS